MLARRAVGADHRPWLEEEAEAWLREVAAERADWYREVAWLTVDTTDLSPAEIADVVLENLAESAACGPAVLAAGAASTER